MFNKPEKYFGLNDTYNVFTKEYVPLVIENRKYTIPNNVNIQGEEWVSINIGYIQLQSSLPTEYQLEILDTNGSSVLKTLTLKEGVIGVDIKPTEEECIWFNENGIRGNYYINSKWLGKIFNIKRGLYIGTAVGADYFNNLYERDNIIRDEQEHFAGYYDNGKPVYYKASNKIIVGHRKFIFTISNVDTFVGAYTQGVQTSNYIRIFGFAQDNYTFGMFIDSSKPTEILSSMGSGVISINKPIVYYTKTTDSRIL